MPTLFAVLHVADAITAGAHLIRPMLLAGPAIAGVAGAAGWLLARSFTSSTLAANDNRRRLAPLPARR
jgi:hypothetical protein